MNPLSDALGLAQARALTALGKAYVREPFDADIVKDALNQMGLRDPGEQDELIAAWGLVNAYGGQAPGDARPAGRPAVVEEGAKPASDKQLAYIADLVKQHKVDAPDLPLSATDARQIIDSLKSGSYDPSKWRVPF